MSRQVRPYYKKSHKAWYVNWNGKPVRLGTNEAEAFTAYGQLLKEKKAQPPAPRKADPPLTEIVNHYLDWCKDHRKPDTYEWYRWRLETFTDEMVGEAMLVSELKPYHLDDWLQAHKDWSSGTKHGFARAVMRCLAWAEKRGRIDRSPVAGYEKPRAGKRTTVVSPEEFEEMLAAVPQQEFKDLLVVTWETGCRPQESLAVEARHVDLENARWIFPPEESKGERWPRIVYLTPKALEVTKRLMQANPTGSLFRNSDGSRWTTDAVNCAFIRLQVALGTKRLKKLGLMLPLTPRLRGTARKDPLKRAAHREALKARKKLVRKLATEHGPKYCLYHLRHTWLNRALTSGVDALTAAVLMGHRDPGTIAKTYQHLTQSPEYLQKAVKKTSGDV